MREKYSKEVERLFYYGDASLSMTWPNYIEELNLKKEHASELIHILNESELSRAISGFTIRDFAPRHAWRALGQLKMVSSVDSLLKVLIDKKNEEAFEYQIELPNVLLLIGNEVIPELNSFLKNNRVEWNFKVIIFETLVKFAIQDPIHKDLILSISNYLFLEHEADYVFISRLLNALFKLNPVDSEMMKEIIDKDKYDFETINEVGIMKFIKDAKMYE